MEELVIRFGATEARNPTSEDVRKALEDVESWVGQREEFTIEKVSNWRPEVIDGQHVIRCVLEPPYATAATFCREDNSSPLGWIATVHTEDGSEFALAPSVSDEAEYIEGMCCGGPLTVRRDCLVSLDVAHEVLMHFVKHQDRSPAHAWVDWRSAIRFIV